MNRYKTLQEKAKAKGKLLLVESVSYIPKQDDVVILTDSKLTESINGKQYECRGILKNVPVTRYTENANGRVYPKSLWENVAKQNMFEGSDCLADHAEDDGSVLSTVGVWHEFTVNEDIATASLYCIGDAGSLLLEKAKAGGKIGFSTVGFGELSESDSKTVIPESYEYENTDWVRKPSQNVYATMEHISESVQKDKINEEIKIEKNIIENKNTNILNNVLENNEVKNDMSEKFIEASLKMQVDQVIKEAVNSGKPVEEIKRLQEVFKTVPADMVETRIKLESTINKLQEKVEADKVAAQTALKEKTGTLESIQKKYAVACDTIKQLREQLKKASKIVEKSVNPEITKSIKAMAFDINQFTKDRVLMESDIKYLLEDIKNMKEDIKVYEEDTILRDKDIAKFKEERKAMKSKIAVTSKQLKKAESHIAGLETVLEEDFGYEFDDDDEFVDDMTDDAILDDELVDYSMDEPIDDIYGEDSDIETGNEVIDEMYEEEDSDEDEDDKEEMDEDEDDEDEEEDEEDDEAEKKAESIRRKKLIMKKKQSIKESKTKIIEAVSQFYQEQVRKTPALRDIRSAIMSSTSLSEAVEKVQRFKQRRFGNDIMKLDESKKKDQGTVKYVFNAYED